MINRRRTILSSTNGLWNYFWQPFRYVGYGFSDNLWLDVLTPLLDFRLFQFQLFFLCLLAINSNFTGKDVSIYRSFEIAQKSQKYTSDVFRWRAIVLSYLWARIKSINYIISAFSSFLVSMTVAKLHKVTKYFAENYNWIKNVLF